MSVSRRPRSSISRRRLSETWKKSLAPQVVEVGIAEDALESVGTRHLEHHAIDLAHLRGQDQIEDALDFVGGETVLRKGFRGVARPDGFVPVVAFQEPDIMEDGRGEQQLAVDRDDALATTDPVHGGEHVVERVVDAVVVQVRLQPFLETFAHPGSERGEAGRKFDHGDGASRSIPSRAKAISIPGSMARAWETANSSRAARRSSLRSGS